MISLKILGGTTPLVGAMFTSGFNLWLLPNDETMIPS